MEQMYLSGLDGNNLKSKHDELVEFLKKNNYSKWSVNLRKNFDLYKLFLDETCFLPDSASNSERKYCVLNGINERVRCTECHNGFVKFNPHGQYQKFCCKECYGKNENSKIKRSNTNLQRWGTKSPSSLPFIRQKIIATNLRKYGVENSACNKDIKEKVMNTNMKKYGCTCFLKSEYGREKIKNSNIKKYGVEFPIQTKTVRNKARTTFLKKYGVENPFQSDECKEKIKHTNLEKYGVENPFQSDECKEKIKHTNLEKYGVEHPYQNDDIKLKGYKTLKQKYGPDRMPKVSKGEKEVRLECKSLYDGEVVFNEREVLGHARELDLWFPAFRFAIEFDGEYWHSQPRDIQADKWKNTRCRNLNIMLLRVSDKEWKSSREEVINSLKVIFKVLTSCQDDVKQKLHEVLFNRLENQMPFGELSAELSQLV